MVTKKIATCVISAVTFLLSMLCLSGCSGLDIERDGLDYRTVPFTHFFDGTHSYTLVTNHTATEFSLQEDGAGDMISMEPGYIPLKIIALGEDRQLLFARGMFDEATSLWSVENRKATKIPLPDHLKDFIFRDAAFFQDHLENRVYFVLYNVVACCNQLYRLNVEDTKLKFDAAFYNDLSFGNNEIDENISMVVTLPNDAAYGNRSLLIFGEKAFYRYTNWVPYTMTRYPYTVEDEVLVQVIDRGKDAESYYLTMSENMTVAKLFACTDPWTALDAQRFYHQEAAKIAEVDGRMAIHAIEGADERLRLLQSDLAALPCGGVGDLGSNNAEGRLPWSAVYYWNGLIDFLTPEYDGAANSEELTGFRAKIEERMDIEMRVLDQLLASPRGLTSNRYGRERIDHLCDLHSSRIFEAYQRYEHYAANPYLLQNQDILIELMSLEKLENSADYLVTARRDDPNGLPEGRHYLRCTDILMTDGVAAPYNYMSGWVSSVCVAEHFGQEIRDEQDLIVRDFMSILLENPEFLDMDEGAAWPYFWGLAYNGYSRDESSSSNISFWPGQKYTADISYRYMDAKAILSMMYQYPDTADREIIDYLRSGIESGVLWPSVNEVFADYGYAPAVPEKDTLLQYCRVCYSYSMQNAAWAWLFLS